MRDNKPDYATIASFRAALRTFEDAAAEAAHVAGLTPQRYLLLLMVKGAPAGDERATISDVAGRLRVRPHTITGAVSRAEEAGLVTRERCTQDRRRIWIRLTGEGERRLETAVKALQTQREMLLAAIEEVAVNARTIAAAEDEPASRRARRH
ncbi:MAG: MarR family transcriptional regulator [Solirubrobacteraceae bacterium]